MNWWLTNNRRLFLTVLEAGKSSVKVLADSVSLVGGGTNTSSVALSNDPRSYKETAVLRKKVD